MNNKTIRLLAVALAIVPLTALAQTVPLVSDAYVIPGTAVTYGTVPTINVGRVNGATSLLQFDLILGCPPG